MIALLLFAAVQAAATHQRAEENPIRRIVNLLQKMGEEVEAEIKKDEDMHEKFECYCKTQTKALDASIAALKDNIPQIEASIKETAANNGNVAAELAQHKQDRADAKEAIESATSQRNKEADAFAKASGDLKANIAACTKAIDAISKGMGASFLQSGAAVALKNLVLAKASSLRRYERETLTAFLSADQSYAPASGEIVGILKQLLENMEGDLKEATDEENAAIAEFEGLVAAKKKEIEAATEAIEAKTERAGEGAVQLVNLKNDLADAQDSLEEDTNYLAELLKSCKTQGSEYEERQAMRAQEKVAIAETVKILNDDDALDLFKKTLSLTQGESFLQTTRSSRDVRDEALEALSGIKSQHVQTGLIQLALLGKKANFEKILKMIDDMVVLLGDEQKNDDKEKDFCNAEFQANDMETSAKEDERSDLETKIEGLENTIETLTQEIKAAKAMVADLEVQQQRASENRIKESKDFQQTIEDQRATQDILKKVLSRLNEFYLVQTGKAKALLQQTPQEEAYKAKNVVAPVKFDEYKKNAGGSSVLTLIGNLIIDAKNLEKEAINDETDAQQAYEAFVASTNDSRSAKEQEAVDKIELKATAQTEKEQATEDHKAAVSDLADLAKYKGDLHSACDFVLKNFDIRQKARGEEIEALQSAIAILSGMQ